MINFTTKKNIKNIINTRIFLPQNQDKNNLQTRYFKNIFLNIKYMGEYLFFFEIKLAIRSDYSFYSLKSLIITL